MSSQMRRINPSLNAMSFKMTWKKNQVTLTFTISTHPSAQKIQAVHQLSPRNQTKEGWTLAPKITSIYISIFHRCKKLYMPTELYFLILGPFVGTSLLFNEWAIDIKNHEIKKLQILTMSISISVRVCIFQPTNGFCELVLLALY